MAGKDKLFDLIKSLSNHEKGYFKANSPKGTIYLKLFDAIAKASEPDDKKLEALLRKAGSNRKYSAVKSYLWSELTKSMVNYTLHNNTLNKLLQKIQVVEMLYRKNLKIHLESEIKALLKSAATAQQYEVMMLVQKLQYRLFTDHHMKIDDNFWKGYYNTIALNTALVDLLHIQQQMFSISMQKQLSNSDERRMLDEQVAAMDKHKEIIANDLFLSSMYENNMAAYYWLIDDAPNSIHHNLQCAGLIEKMNNNERDSQLIAIYTNVAAEMGELNQRDKAHNMIDWLIAKLKALTDKGYNVQWQLAQTNAIRALVVRDYKNIDNIAAILHKTDIELSPMIKRNLYNILSCAYYHMRGTGAIDFIKAGMDMCYQHKVNIPPPIRTLEILIHFELGNYQYVQNQLKTAIKQLTTNGSVNTPRLITYRFLLKSIKTPNPKKELKKLITQLQAEHPNEYNAIYFSFTTWAKAVYSGKGYYEIAGGNKTGKSAAVPKA